MVRHRSLAAACGVVADRVLGEPPPPIPHPVAQFGRLVRAVEHAACRPSRVRGATFAAICTAVAVAAGAAAGRSDLATGGATALSVAGHALGDAADEVAMALHRGDLAEARRRLPSLVGRDPSHLDEDEICRAAVESVAENTVDAIVAPAVWGAVAGAPGTLGYRAVNTLDAMVGYRSERYERFGWASARLDDVANWVPARLTALLVMAVRPRAATAIITAVRRDAKHHPSPNAGVAEAAFAGALGLRLGGANTYGERVEVRATLGDGAPPAQADIARAVRLSNDVGLALAVVLAAPAAVALLQAKRSRS